MSTDSYNPQIKMILCPTCDIVVTKSNIARHKRTHLPRKCKLCEFVYDNQTSLNKHKKYNHPKKSLPIICLDCGQSCATKSGLAVHRKIHTIRIPVICPTCYKSFTNKQAFSLHNRIHLGLPNWKTGLTQATDPRIHIVTKETREKKSKAMKLLDRWGENNPIHKHTYTDEERKQISERSKKWRIENPDKLISWLPGPSKGEIFFEKYLTKIGIPGIKNYPVDGYFLDFAYPEQMIDFELDGEQHYDDKQKFDHDVRRNIRLQSLGWKVIRLRFTYGKFKSLEKINRQKILSNCINILKYYIENSKSRLPNLVNMNNKLSDFIPINPKDLVNSSAI